jgi:hypothetical protein
MLLYVCCGALEFRRLLLLERRLDGDVVPLLAGESRQGTIGQGAKREHSFKRHHRCLPCLHQPPPDRARGIVEGSA